MNINEYIFLQKIKLILEWIAVINALKYRLTVCTCRREDIGSYYYPYDEQILRKMLNWKNSVIPNRRMKKFICHTVIVSSFIFS